MIPATQHEGRLEAGQSLRPEQDSLDCSRLDAI